jgi:Fe-Mn family superoxide dismutase
VALPDRYGALSRARERSILLWFLARALTLCDVSANVTQGNKLRSLMVLSVLVAAALAQNLPLPPLPYDYTSLEPHIDEATMRVHHMSHHQTYTDKLNGALAKLRADPEQKWLAKLGVDALLRRLDDISDEGIRKTVRNAGGGYVNHDVFFHSMSPTGGGTLEGDGLAGELVRTYGSVMRFKQAFTLAALEVFGSGWAWLVYDVRDKGLRITSTSNQDTPAMQEGMVPLLALDVWEHAYYIKHQSRRKDYIEAFWEVVNWLEVATRLEAAVDQAAQLEDKPEL